MEVLLLIGQMPYRLVLGQHPRLQLALTPVPRYSRSPHLPVPSVPSPISNTSCTTIAINVDLVIGTYVYHVIDLVLAVSIGLGLGTRHGIDMTSSKPRTESPTQSRLTCSQQIAICHPNAQQVVQKAAKP